MDQRRHFLPPVSGQVTASITINRHARKPGQVARPGLRALPSRLLSLGLCAMLAACANMPRSLTRFDQGPLAIELHITATQTLLGVHFARYQSGLSGSIQFRGKPRMLYRVARGPLALRVSTLTANGDAVPDAQELALFAGRMAGLRDVLAEFMRLPVGEMRVHAIFVPAEHRLTYSALRIFRGDDISIALAVRLDAHDEARRARSLRDAVMTFAHEMMHVLLHTHGISRPSTDAREVNAEESAAYTLEHCVELRLFGATSPRDTALYNTLRARYEGPETATTSLESGIDNDTTLESLFRSGAPTITRDDPRAADLLELCRTSIQRVIYPDGPPPKREHGK